MFICKSLVYLIDLKDYKTAIEYIGKNLNYIYDSEDLDFVYLACGLLSIKLCAYHKAIDYFSESIKYMEGFDIIS